MSTIREEILQEAIHCVCGDREQDYGTPENNFQTIANLWNDYLKAARPDMFRGICDSNLSGKDVAIMMALLKIARIATGSKRDSFVDLAGYAACAAEIEGESTSESKSVGEKKNKRRDKNEDDRRHEIQQDYEAGSAS